ncbi:MAG: GTP-dependent dephospho-CoA kinase family protein [Candidatus Lokiarchaeia archaeon]
METVRDLVLPIKLRERLKQPFGTLLRGKHPESTLKAKNMILEKMPPKVVTVGDVVTRNLIELELVPDISIIDGKTLRTTNENVNVPNSIQMKAQNPAATISAGIWDTLKKAYESDVPIELFIEGEEDLLTMPAIILAPDKSFVIYGQPKEGIVIVEVNENKRKEVKEILSQMEAV